MSAIVPFSAALSAVTPPGLCTHLATDVPKHYDESQVKTLSTSIAHAASVPTASSGWRSSISSQTDFAIAELTLRKKDIFARTRPILEATMGPQTYGRYWLPGGTYTLGEEAGRLIARELLSAPAAAEQDRGRRK